MTPEEELTDAKSVITKLNSILCTLLRLYHNSGARLPFEELRITHQADCMIVIRLQKAGVDVIIASAAEKPGNVPYNYPANEEIPPDIQAELNRRFKEIL